LEVKYPKKSKVFYQNWLLGKTGDILIDEASKASLADKTAKLKLS
jgi:hypothetical protein